MKSKGKRSLIIKKMYFLLHLNLTSTVTKGLFMGIMCTGIAEILPVFKKVLQTHTQTSKQIVGPKIVWVQTYFESDKDFKSDTHFVSNKIFGPKKLGQTNIRSTKNFGP